MTDFASLGIAKPLLYHGIQLYAICRDGREKRMAAAKKEWRPH